MAAVAGQGGFAAVLFDKDGTLFDFTASWGGYAEALVADLADGDAALAARLFSTLGYDPEAGRYDPDSPVIAATAQEAAARLLPHLPAWGAGPLVARMDALAEATPQVPAVPLAALLDRLLAAGLILGVATNDAEAVARTHLERAGVADRFSLILGCDSGHGAKPDPGPIRAFVRHTGARSDRVAMVGDSLTDMAAARAAGAVPVAVLTGPAEAQTLAPHAAAVLRDIGDLPSWLGL
ncbi:HAD family hydrolase [Rhodobacteraceae bacterium CCMM004]|nr:HAD family hydrolase [Rhodobacteraceae bacterium CCMM004]